MLHAQISKTKAETAQSKTQVVPQRGRELHPPLLSPVGLYSSSDISGVASGASPEAQRRQTLAGMQSAHGNQAVLRMLHSPQQVMRMTPLRPSQGMMLQRKCACGGSGGECAECKARDEGSLQTKLTVNQPGDVYEREADRVAEQVMRMPEPRLQRACACGGGCSTCQTEQPGREHESLQTKRVQASDTGQIAVPPIVHEVLRSPSQPLDPATRAFMEPRFGYDFSLVRVHSGTTAEQSAQDVNANAYTVGRDIVFASGQYAPNTADGRKLIAHELVHVVQQGGDRTLAALQRKDRTHWRDGRPLFYETKAEAQVQMDYVQSLGKSELLKLDGTIAVAPDGPVKEKEGWTFFYFPLTEAEANAAKDTAEAKLNKKNVFTVESDKRAASFYIRPKCPDAAPEEAGWTPWSACFPTEDKAKAQVKKFQVAHIEAKIGQLQKDQFFVLFQPLTKAEAEVKGETEAKTRGGFAEGMFTVEAKEVPELGGWAYELKVGCPKGFKPLGQFEITSYFTAVESDFPETPTEKDPCIKDTFRERFLHNGNDKGDKSPFGVDMEGNGLTLAGKFIHYKGKNCYEEVSAPLDARDQPLIVDSSVAVDDKKIRLGTRLQIQDVGLRTAADVGGKVKVNRIDLFKGLFNKAKDTTLKDKLVCQEEKP